MSIASNLLFKKKLFELDSDICSLFMDDIIYSLFMLMTLLWLFVFSSGDVSTTSLLLSSHYVDMILIPKKKIILQKKKKRDQKVKILVLQ